MSASPLREPAQRAFPKAAEAWDLDWIVADYTAAALRCREGGCRSTRRNPGVLAPAGGSMNSLAYLWVFGKHRVTPTLAQRLRSVRRTQDGRLTATLYSEYTEAETERIVDQVVVEHGSLPMDELYVELVSGSTNLGEVDHRALLAREKQTIVRNEAGTYQRFRIRDAVAARNVHAAIYDALRLCLPV